MDPNNVKEEEGYFCSVCDTQVHIGDTYVQSAVRVL